MKLSTSTALIIAAAGSILTGAAARSIVSPLSEINLFPRANFEVEVNAAHANSVDGLGLLYGHHGFTRTYGMASIYPAFLGRIKQQLGTDNINAAALGGVNQVQTLRLMGTSPWHTDRERDGRHQKRKAPKNDKLQVGLFFSNTNEDAYFETKDGDLCIPIVEGIFVSFDGRVPHRSVVMSGHIDMVGPFSLSNDVLVNVGGYTLGATAGFLLDSYKPLNEGRLEAMAHRNRQLSANNNSSNIEGSLVMGDMKDSEEYGDHFLAFYAAGLPPNCTDDCAIAIALANSRECTEDVYDSALKVLLSKELSYSTDEGGNTNDWHEQFFDNLEIENSPISLSEVFSMVDAAAGLIDSLFDTHFAPVVYLYDKEKVPVACAYLESLSDEEKEELSMIFNGDEEDTQVVESDPSDAVAADVVGGGNGSGSAALVPKFAVSVITACALILLSL